MTTASSRPSPWNNSALTGRNITTFPMSIFRRAVDEIQVLLNSGKNSGYCTVLYCTVLYCTVLYCTVLYCTVLYCIVLYCTVLYCAVLYCTVRYCTRRPVYIFHHISFDSSLNEKCLRQRLQKTSKHTQFLINDLFFFFFENRAVCEKMGENIVELGRPQMTDNMAHAHCTYAG